MRGNKKRAKNDRADARHLRELLMAKRIPESWIAPEHLLDLRARVRLRHRLSEQRGKWQPRIQSVLYHHGCPQRGDLMNAGGLAWLAAQPLPPVAREQVSAALAIIEALDGQIAPLDRELGAYARRQPGCKALLAHYGIGPVTAVTILAELGDPHRFSSSREAVRYAGLDITVHQSDQRRAPGHLSRQGPPALRWALFEAAQCARRRTSPDHAYYTEAAAARASAISASTSTRWPSSHSRHGLPARTRDPDTPADQLDVVGILGRATDAKSRVSRALPIGATAAFGWEFAARSARLVTATESMTITPPAVNCGVMQGS